MNSPPVRMNPSNESAGKRRKHSLFAGIALVALTTARSSDTAIDKGMANGPTGILTAEHAAGFARRIDYPSLANVDDGDGMDIGAPELGESLVPISASRKFHGGVPFDIDLPLSGNAGIECRNPGANFEYQMIMNFPGPVTVMGASVTTGVGSVGNLAVNGSEVTVDLTGVGNLQTIVLTLTGVSDGTNTTNVNVPMGVLRADTNADRFVNSGDALQTRSRAGQAADLTNFRSDVNTDGFVNSGDTTLVRSRSGTALP